MDDLAEFLLARIAEDERAAQLAPERMVERLERQGEDVARRYGDPSPPEDDVSLADAMWWTAKDAAAWIARHDPARVLAECEAKRRIVRAAQAAEVSRSIGDAEDLAWAYTHDILRMLALPYADHPDYRPEWKP